MYMNDVFLSSLRFCTYVLFFGSLLSLYLCLCLYLYLYLDLFGLLVDSFI